MPALTPGRQRSFTEFARLFPARATMGCGGSTYQPDGPIEAPEEAAGQSGAPAFGDLKTSAYASAKPRRSEVDYNRARNPCRTRGLNTRPTAGQRGPSGWWPTEARGSLRHEHALALRASWPKPAPP